MRIYLLNAALKANFSISAKANTKAKSKAKANA